MYISVKLTVCTYQPTDVLQSLRDQSQTIFVQTSAPSLKRFVTQVWACQLNARVTQTPKPINRSLEKILCVTKNAQTCGCLYTFCQNELLNFCSNGSRIVQSCWNFSFGPLKMGKLTWVGLEISQDLSISWTKGHKLKKQFLKIVNLKKVVGHLKSLTPFSIHS